MARADVPGDLNEYHQFAGKFVTEYAALEFMLRQLIRLMSGLDQARYDILVGFPRSGEARALAKKLAEFQSLDERSREAVNDAFDQLDCISKLRDW